ncbi:MAG: hypothetical protein IKU55_05135 [Clostridia bacterium]|nr:hypothetical protein [Clostridia bacterium]
MNTIKLHAPRVKMVAHRGLSGLERENTCAAFLAAANRSYYGIETDVHKTADGKFVVIHDETLTRVSLGAVTTNVETATYAEFANVVLPDLDGSDFRRDLQVPLLAEYISICKKYEKICVLELKNAFSAEDIEKMLAEIRGLDYLDGVTFISFDWQNCVTLRALLPQANIQFLTGESVTAEMIANLRENRMDLDIYYRRLTKAAVEELHAAGILVNCWTCDDLADAEALVAMGVDMITSNILE